MKASKVHLATGWAALGFLRAPRAPGGLLWRVGGRRCFLALAVAEVEISMYSNKNGRFFIQLQGVLQKNRIREDKQPTSYESR